MKAHITLQSPIDGTTVWSGTRTIKDIANNGEYQTGTVKVKGNTYTVKNLGSGWFGKA